MAGEGIVALRYGFIQLRFNDKDLGVYAYEEHFGPELLEHNGRAEGRSSASTQLVWTRSCLTARFDEAYRRLPGRSDRCLRVR